MSEHKKRGELLWSNPDSQIKIYRKNDADRVGILEFTTEKGHDEETVEVELDGLQMDKLDEADVIPQEDGRAISKRDNK